MDYEICYGNYANVKKLRDIEELSEKLTKDYKLLLKMGLTKNEAIVICSKLSDTSFNIQKSEKNMEISNKIELGKDKVLGTSRTSQITRTSRDSKGIDKPPSMANNTKVEKDMEIEI